MDLKVVGAGLGRTGTHTLKVVLEQLLGGPCYHMVEVFGHPEHAPMWRAAYEGESVDFDTMLDGYVALVDWPGSPFWRELSAANPDASILLSTRDSADTWWRSADNTIFNAMSGGLGDGEWEQMANAMMNAFDPNWREEGPAKAAYERHNAAVRAEAPADRLVEWHPGDGWEPLCTMLGVPVPDQPFPVTNTTEEWQSRTGLTPPS
jgi:sulfotransferase family protein